MSALRVIRPRIGPQAAPLRALRSLRVVRLTCACEASEGCLCTDGLASVRAKSRNERISRNGAASSHIHPRIKRNDEGKEMSGKEQKEGAGSKGLRGAKPITAQWVDELRQRIGVERTNALLRASMQGRRDHAAGWMYAVEVSPDGKVHEFGPPPPRSEVGGRGMHLGSSPAPLRTGNSSRLRGAATGLG